MEWNGDLRTFLGVALVDPPGIGEWVSTRFRGNQ